MIKPARIALLLICVALALAVSLPVTAQSTPPLRIVNLTDAGIAFYEVTDDNTLIPLGGPLTDFAVEYLGGSAPWMILAKESFSISPNGRYIAFTAQRNDDAALFIYDTTDTTLRQHPIVSYWLLPTLWSPDSEAVLLHAGNPYWGDLPIPDDYVYEIATDDLFQITFTRGWESGLQWSANAESLVYFGWCNPDPCGNPLDDVYLVIRDGETRFPLTDLSKQLASRMERSACYMTWSPNDQRWYYVIGCGNRMETRRAYVYSTNLDGDNHLEFELEDYLRGTEGEGISFEYALVKGIHPRPEGVYFSTELSYFPDLDIHPDLENVILTEWRVLRLTPQGEIETVYQQPFSNITTRKGKELTGSAIAPDGQRMIMEFSNTSAYVIDATHNQNIGEVHHEQDICDVRWRDNRTIVYNVGQCNSFWGAPQVQPQAAWQMNVLTGEVTSLTAELDGISWVLPIPEAEVLAQLD